MKRVLWVVLILSGLATADVHAQAVATTTVPQVSPGAVWSTPASGIVPGRVSGGAAYDLTMPYPYPPQPFTPLPPAATPYPRPGTVPVVIESPRGVQKIGLPEGLAYKSAGFSFGNQGYGYTRRAYGQPLCQTPCTLYAAPGQLNFQATTSDGPPTNFYVTVPPEGTRVTVRVRKPSKVGRVLGQVLVGLGAAVLSVGVASVGFSRTISQSLLPVGAAMASSGVTLFVLDQRRGLRGLTGVAHQENLAAPAPPPPNLSLAPLGLTRGAGVSVALTF